jgi:Ras-related GTP-binding protein C/D
VDGLSDDHKIGNAPLSYLFFFPTGFVETQRDITQRIMDELMDTGMDHIQLSFYLTSIYDHSIFEAFSKVIQKLVPQLPTLENLLNLLCSVSRSSPYFVYTFGAIICDII